MFGGAGHRLLCALLIIGTRPRLGPDLSRVRPGLLNLLWRDAAAKNQNAGDGASQARAYFHGKSRYHRFNTSIYKSLAVPSSAARFWV